ncbi:cell wall-binding repeat-containing protein [Euzebya sp.]|uniref:cell wall-binding repeat-containing protein n=1 Tax=Euzebya sp. TaxID=1971409 RepID=UPI0035179DC7
MLRRLLPAVLLLALLPAAPAASQGSTFQGSTFQALGCYDDVTGDAGAPQADLVEVCVNYDRTQANVVVILDTVGNLDPVGDAAWENEDTRAVVGFSTDADDDVELVLEMFRGEAEGEPVLAASLVDDDGADVCEPQTLVVAGQIAARFAPDCIGASPVRMAATMMYQPTAGTAVAVDSLPDDGLTLPLSDEPAPSPVCANPTVDPGQQLTIRRLACGIGGTEPISQAVATSQFVFDRPDTDVIDAYQGAWAVIARNDDFADALAGSSLSFGQGPLLFTYSPQSAPADRDPGQLATITRAELLRTLPRGETVYLLGGTSALDPGLDEEITALGYEVVRFAGTGREQTARLISAAVADKLDTFVGQTDFIDTNSVLIATRSNWPDAVVAGSIGAFWGMPILLMDVNPPVHPDTLAALDELRPDYIHVIGGTGVISNDAARAMADHARGNGYALGNQSVDTSSGPWSSFCGSSFVCRWGGANRVQTGGAVGQLNRDLVQRFGEMTTLVPENPQQYAAAVSLAAGPFNYAYALAAATVSGRFGGAVFIPTENQDLSQDIVNDFCFRAGSEGFIELVEEVLLVGDTDLLSDGYADQIRQLVEGGCPPAPTFAGASAATAVP